MSEGVKMTIEDAILDVGKLEMWIRETKEEIPEWKKNRIRDLLFSVWYELRNPKQNK
jgi:hypothetical protein